MRQPLSGPASDRSMEYVCSSAAHMPATAEVVWSLSALAAVAGPEDNVLWKEGNDVKRAVVPVESSDWRQAVGRVRG